MRLKRRTWAFLAIGVACYWWYTSGSARQASAAKNLGNHQRDPQASVDKVNPFAGSDIVVYTPSSTDSVWLQVRDMLIVMFTSGLLLSKQNLI